MKWMCDVLIASYLGKKKSKISVHPATELKKKNNDTLNMMDKRFAGLFQRKDFEQDHSCLEYRLRNPGEGIHSNNIDSDINGEYRIERMV